MLQEEKLKMHTRSVKHLLSLVGLAVVFGLSGCAKKPVAVTPPPTPPPPPAAVPRPTVTLKASSNFLQQGESVTLSWSSTNATDLDLQPAVGKVSPEGSTKVSPTGSTTYTITATGPGGTATDSARITVAAAAAPTPAPAPAPSFAEWFDQNIKDAFFDFDKSDIRPDARDALAKTAEALRSRPDVKVVIQGHCDERGSTEYNLALGDRRAQAVRQFLISLGISADRMQTVSYGKEKPFCTTHDEECWQLNRRGHFVPAQ